MGGGGNTVTNSLLLWLEDEDEDKNKNKATFDPDEWTTFGTKVSTTPQQVRLAQLACCPVVSTGVGLCLCFFCSVVCFLCVFCAFFCVDRTTLSQNVVNIFRVPFDQNGRNILGESGVV